jgi:hypothetical protein
MAVVVCLTAIGISISLAIVRNEGFEGLWKRKRNVIEAGRPEARPVLDKLEQGVKKTVMP